MLNNKLTFLAGSILTLTAATASAVNVTDICPDAASRTRIHGALKTLLINAQAEDNGGFGFHMWGAVVNRDGVVCAIASSGMTEATNSQEAEPLQHKKLILQTHLVYQVLLYQLQICMKQHKMVEAYSAYKKVILSMLQLLMTGIQLNTEQHKIQW